MPFTVVVCTNGSAMLTRARVRYAEVNFKERIEDNRSGGKQVEGKQVFHVTKVLPG